MARSRRLLLNPWTLGVFTLVVCLWGIRGGPRLGDHECINAQCARQMLQSGNWLVPTLGEAPRIRKPPLGSWLIAASTWLVEPANSRMPVNELSARLPQALAAVVNVFIIAWMATRMYGRRIGKVAGLVAAGSLLTLYFSHSALIEMTLTLFVTLSFASFWRALEGETVNRRWLAAGYVAFALAMLAKMPLPLAVVAPPIFIFWVFVTPALALAERTAPLERRWQSELWMGVRTQLRCIWRLWSTPGVLAVFALCGGWIYIVAAQSDGVWQLWRQEYIDRFTGGMADRSHPFWYYLPVVFGMVAPFSLLLPEAVAAPWMPRYHRYRRANAFLLTWGISGLLVLSASAFKRPHYLAAVMPPFLILLAPVVDRFFLVGGEERRRGIRAFCNALPFILSAAAIAGAVMLTQQFPGIGRGPFVALIALVALWTVASISFRRGQGTVSLATIMLASPVMLALGWTLAAYDEQNNDVKIPALASAIADSQARPGCPIVQIDSRIDARLMFYEHLNIEQLFTPVQLARMRPNRSSLSQAVMDAAGERVRSLLAADPDTLFILKAEHFDSLRGDYNLPLVELARVALSRDDPSNASVILGRDDGAVSLEPRAIPAANAPRQGDRKRDDTHQEPVS
ncbi:MAG: glycosyltransferase family 39 protein [Phycisphaerales bacterium]|nr:glycosyltransferase family 39 protein [Phycisphaerales bacterium]